MKEENPSKEFDIIRALSKMFKRKWSLAIFLITFTVLGIIVAVNNPKTYTSEVILAPRFKVEEWPTIYPIWPLNSDSI